jgi:hypothetical protein
MGWGEKCKRTSEELAVHRDRSDIREAELENLPEFVNLGLVILLDAFVIEEAVARNDHASSFAAFQFVSVSQE